MKPVTGWKFNFEITVNKTIVVPKTLFSLDVNDIFTFKGKTKQWRLESKTHKSVGCVLLVIEDKKAKSKSILVNVKTNNRKINYIANSTVFTEDEIESSLNTGISGKSNPKLSYEIYNVNIKSSEDLFE